MSESENSNNCEYEEPEMLFVSLSQHFSVQCDYTESYSINMILLCPHFMATLCKTLSFDSDMRNQWLGLATVLHGIN